MTSLYDHGFEKDVWYEVIITTYSDEGSPHASAMGCTAVDEQHLLLKPFTNTTTFKNLKERKQAVAHITHNPELFYKVVFKKELTFSHAATVKAPVLTAADAWVELGVEKIEFYDQHRANVVAKAIKTVEQAVKPKPYSRAEHALIECLVHYTRVAVFANTSRHQEAVELAEKIREYVKLVNRVSRTPAHLLICEEILETADKLVGRR